MEIHAPEGPVSSLKEFLVHIGIVTIGILIALSLEGLVEWNHHRHLVTEARENITIEVQDNKKELGSFLKSVPQTQENYEKVLQFIRTVLARQKPNIHSLELHSNLTDLSSTSWATAQTVGALSFMNYNEVKKYARVYQMQEEFIRLQQKNLDNVVSAIALFGEGDPGKLPEADLRVAKAKVLDSISGLTAQNQIGQQLMVRYGEVAGK